jgi:hypothetical protein
MVQSRAHDLFGLAIVTLDEGKTFQDLDAWPSTDQPPWTTLLSFAEASPGSGLRTVWVPAQKRPIFMVCFTAYPETKTTVLGPVAVRE